MADLDLTSCNFVSVSFISCLISSVSMVKLSFSETHDHNTEQYTIILRCSVHPDPLMISAANCLLYNVI